MGLLLGLLLLVALTPSARAEENDEASFKDAILDGLRYVGKGIVDFFAKIFYGIFGGFIDKVLNEGLFDMVKNALIGLGSGLALFGQELFGGAGVAMQASYHHLIVSLEFFGPFAPWVAGGIISGLVVGAAMLIAVLLDKADDVLPEKVEEMFEDDNETIADDD